MLRFIKGVVLHLCFWLTTKYLSASLVIQDLLIIWMNGIGQVKLSMVRHEVGILFQLLLLYICIQLFKILFYLMIKVLPLRWFTLFAYCQLFKIINYLYGHCFVFLRMMLPPVESVDAMLAYHVGTTLSFS